MQCTRPRTGGCSAPTLRPSADCQRASPRQGEIERTEEMLPGYEDLEREKNRKGVKRRAEDDASAEAKAAGKVRVCSLRGIEAAACAGVEELLVKHASLPSHMPGSLALQDPKLPGEKKKRKQQEDGSGGDCVEGQPAKKKKKKKALEGGAAQPLGNLSMAEQARLAGQLAAVGAAPAAELPASQRAGSQPPSAKKKGTRQVPFFCPGCPLQDVVRWSAWVGWFSSDADRAPSLPCSLAAPYQITEDVWAAIDRIKAVAAQQPAPPPAPEGEDGKKARKLLPKPLRDALADFSSLYLLQLDAFGNVSAAAPATSLACVQRAVKAASWGTRPRPTGVPALCARVSPRLSPRPRPPTSFLLPALTPAACLCPPPAACAAAPAGRRPPHHGRAAPLAGPLLLSHQPGGLPARRQQGALARCAVPRIWQACARQGVGELLATRPWLRACVQQLGVCPAGRAVLPAGAQAQGGAGAE